MLSEVSTGLGIAVAYEERRGYPVVLVACVVLIVVVVVPTPPYHQMSPYAPLLAPLETKARDGPQAAKSNRIKCTRGAKCTGIEVSCL